MDIYYPLSYSNNSIKLVEGRDRKMLSNARGMLSTIAGERYDPDFGLNYELFFTTGIPDIIVDEARDALDRSGFTGQVKLIGYELGTVSLEVLINTETLTETIIQITEFGQ
ncbi:MAG: hypothetical protein F6K55_03375 [Moorea sp. SIO4A3]|nr:hypothetical protein [Moorena sp. SIO4A3]